MFALRYADDDSTNEQPMVEDSYVNVRQRFVAEHNTRSIVFTGNSCANTPSLVTAFFLALIAIVRLSKLDRTFFCAIHFSHGQHHEMALLLRLVVPPRYYAASVTLHTIVG